MTRYDIERLDLGDSIIGLPQALDDEVPVLAVGEAQERNGRLTRPITARRGADTIAAVIREGDTTIRCARRA